MSWLKCIMLNTIFVNEIMFGARDLSCSLSVIHLYIELHSPLYHWTYLLLCFVKGLSNVVITSFQCYSVLSTIAQVSRKMSLKILAF